MNNKYQIIPIAWFIIAVLAGGGLLLSLGTLILTFVLYSGVSDTNAVTMGGMSLLGMGLSAAGVWAGLTGWKQTPSPRARNRWSWLVWGILTVIIALIGAFIPATHHGSSLFAPLHLGLILFPALGLMALMLLAAGRKHAPTLRQMFLTLSGGMLSAGFALPLELFGFIFSGLLIVGVAYLFPGGEAEVQRLINLFETWMIAPPSDIEDVLELATSPVVLGVLALALAILTPLIEELGKTLILGVMGIWHKASLTRAFLWGAMCGLGFGILEGITNGAMGLGEVAGWLGGTATRFLATGMHALTSGFIGLGWGLFWQKRWWWAPPLGYIAAAFFHGLWNLNVVFAVGGASIGMTLNPGGYVLMLFGAAVALILILLLPVGLFGLPWMLRRQEELP